MTAVADAVQQLLAAGGPGRRPASAIAGVLVGSRREVAADGWAQLPQSTSPGAPMTPDMVLDLASVTKVASTTTLAMRLHAEGQLSLTSPAHRYLPTFRGGGKDDITLEQLLSHTAGLQPWWPLYCETLDREEAIERTQTLPLTARPGATWVYSDLGFILLGRVIEHITTYTLADAFDRLVAEPLGLSTRYGPVPAERAAASADSDGYEFRMVATGQPYHVPHTTGQFSGWRRHALRGVVNDGNAAHSLDGVSGHAGLFSSVDDLLTLGAALVAGDFIPRPVLERFATADPANGEQALGFRRGWLEVDGERLTLLHHGGFTGTCFAFTLERDLVFAGGAMRLHGTLGNPPYDEAAPVGIDLVPGPAIHKILLDAAQHALLEPSPAPATLGDDR
jgi:CubicO group peptidase (beta-lactamase class C family)